MELLQRPFSRRWIFATLLVVGGMCVLARLGTWQLDRLEQRRTFNARVLAQVNQPELQLSGGTLNADLANSLSNMEYRPVTVTGTYDFSQQVALRGQYWGNEWGVHLLTPLHIQGSAEAVLVDRGWIPGPDYESGNWSKFDEPGVVTVQGIVRRSQAKADFGSRNDPTPAPGAAPLKDWNFANIAGLSQQVSLPMLPVYVQQAPDPSWTGLPYRQLPQLDLTEGPHMSYAIQWFSFAVMLGLGYPFYIRRQEKRAQEKARRSVGEEGDRKVGVRS